MNFYEILELDENERNPQNIEKKIEEKRKIWNRWRNQGTPKQQELAKEYLSNIEEIRKIVTNATLREKYRREFIEANKKRKKEAFEELDNVVIVLSSNEISQKQFEEIKKQFKNILSEEEIRKRLLKNKISIVSDKKKSFDKNIKPKLEPSKEKEINNLLNLLGKKDLYDFLSLPKNSSLQLLQNRAEEIWKKSRGKTDLENSRKAKLAGEAKSIFSSLVNKEKYDNTLSSAHLKKLNKTLNVLMADKVLTQENISQLLKIAKKFNISEDEAKEYIEEVADKKKCVIVGNFSKINIKSCVFCGEIIENESRCPGCGEKVVQKCPVCSRNIKITEKTCKHCGFVIADLKEIKKYMNEVENLIALSKYEEAENVLNKIIKMWNLKEVQDKFRIILSKKKEKIIKYKEIEDLINRKFYIKANEKLVEYIKLYSSDEKVKKLEKDIASVLQKVKFLSNEMEKFKHAKNYSAVVEKYEEINSIVKDYEDAKKILQNLPLTVDDVSYQKISDNLKLTWKCSLNDFSFLVIRKENIPPLNCNDGEVVANTKNLEIIDTEFEKGKIFYYAVYLIKDNITFLHSKTIGPVFIPKPITDVNIKGLEGKIELIWKKPKYCEEITIYKKQTANKFLKEDATLIKPVSDFYVDNDVKNNFVYGYMFVGKYKHPAENKIVYSEPTFFFAMPTSLPKPLSEYNYKIENKKLFIDFKDIKENISFALLKEEPSFSFNETLSINDIKKYKLYNAAGNRAQIPIQSQGSIYIVPFSVKNEVAVVGKIREEIFIEDVKDVRTKYKNDKLWIYFNPPEGAKHFLLTYSYDKFMNKTDNSVNKKIYSIEEYNKNGGCLILDINKEIPHYLILYVYDYISNNISKGVRFIDYCGDKLKIKYRIEKIKQFIFLGSYKKVFIKLELENRKKDTFEINNVLVVFKKDSVPLNKEDGVVIRKMKKVKFENGKGRINIPRKYWDLKGYVKLFFKEKGNEHIRLLPAKEEFLKL